MVIKSWKFFKQPSALANCFVILAWLSAMCTSCGKPSDGDGSGYQSCVLSGNTTSSQCVEAKDSTDMRSACESYPGVYELARCTVSSGVKGCKYTNKFGVVLTDWFTGESYASDESFIQTQCSGIAKQGVVVTK